MTEEVTDLISSIKLQMYFSLSKSIEEDLATYNYYIVRDPSRYLTLDSLLDSILANLIEAQKGYSKLNSTIWIKYIAIHYDTFRHIKSGKDYEFYKLICVLCKSKLMNFSSADDYSLLTNIENLIIKLKT